jgi:hypothetical protein
LAVSISSSIVPFSVSTLLHVRISTRWHSAISPRVFSRGVRNLFWDNAE